MVHVRTTLAPADWTSAHPTRSPRLTIPVTAAIASSLPARGRVAVHVTLRGFPGEVMLTGTIAAVQTGARPAVELIADPESSRRLTALDGAAGGPPPPASDRKERFAARLPVAVSNAGEVGAGRYMTTLDVSEGGCALRWSGQAPAAGEPLRLRIGAGRTSVEVGAEVRWSSAAPHGTVVGLRFTEAQRLGLRTLLGELDHPKPRSRSA